MAIRENLRNIQNDLQETQKTIKKQLKETEIKQLINCNLYTYFIEHLKYNKNNFTEFQKLYKKEETKEKIIEILKDYEIENFKIKAYLNKNYNSILKLAKNDIDKNNAESMKNCLLRVLNNRFAENEDIEKTYYTFTIIKNRDLLCESILAENKNFDKNDFIDFMQSNYYKLLKQVYNMYKQDQKAKNYFEITGNQQAETKKKKAKSFFEIVGKITAVLLLFIGKCFLLVLAACFGWFLGMCSVAKKKK